MAALPTDSAIEFYGDTDPLDDTTTSAVSNGAMSAEADAADWTNADDAPYAKLILLWQHPSGALDGDIYVHVQLKDVDGTNDTPVPTTGNTLNRCGRFEIDSGQAVTTDTAYVAFVNLTRWSTKSSQIYRFYLFNDAGQSMSANWDLDIVPSTLGPHG